MSEEIVFEGTGIVKSKEEASTKKGDAYWKFKILGTSGEAATSELTYSIFEHKAGVDIHVNDNVQLVWTESEVDGTHGPITYRNLRSIHREAKKFNCK